jgi:hypothetical protein
MEFTVGTATRDKFRRAQDFLRRVFPDGDPGAIFDYGLDLIIAEAEKQMFAATTRPRPARPATPGSRTIHAHVRRAVWTRDGGRCAFVGRKGRCSERSFLEYHHIQPHAHGGEATEENIALRCRAHNAYESELIFGPFDADSVRETAPAYGLRPRGSVLEQFGRIRLWPAVAAARQCIGARVLMTVSGHPQQREHEVLVAGDCHGTLVARYAVHFQCAPGPGERQSVPRLTSRSGSSRTASPPP